MVVLCCIHVLYSWVTCIVAAAGLPQAAGELEVGGGHLMRGAIFCCVLLCCLLFILQHVYISLFLQICSCLHVVGLCLQNVCCSVVYV